jgi:hypothetical protein
MVVHFQRQHAQAMGIAFVGLHIAQLGGIQRTEMVRASRNQSRSASSPVWPNGGLPMSCARQATCTTAPISKGCSLQAIDAGVLHHHANPVAQAADTGHFTLCVMVVGVVVLGQRMYLGLRPRRRKALENTTRSWSMLKVAAQTGLPSVAGVRVGLISPVPP